MTKSIVIQPKKARILFSGVIKPEEEYIFSSPWSSKGERFEVPIGNSENSIEAVLLRQLDNIIVCLKDVESPVFMTQFFNFDWKCMDGVRIKELDFLGDNLQDLMLRLYEENSFPCFITYPLDKKSPNDEKELTSMIQEIRRAALNPFVNVLGSVMVCIPSVNLPECCIDRNGINVSEGYHRDVLCGLGIEGYMVSISQSFILWVEDPQGKEVIFAAYVDKSDFIEYWPHEGE